MSNGERAAFMAVHSPEWTYDRANYGEFWQLPISAKRALYDVLAEAQAG